MLHAPAQRRDLTQAFVYCERLAKGRHENFTVVSWFFPKRIRPSMYAVYAFCRHTDDLGDETPGDRLALLDAWEDDLKRCFGGEPHHPIFVALQENIQQHHIPAEPFLELIEANRMDQRVRRYETYAEVCNYCEYSANSVGRMVLRVFGYADNESERLSDATCTALQLTNFCQDVRRDYAKGRIYLPQEDMKCFGYTEEMLARGEYNPAFRKMLAFEVDRAQELFRLGVPLVHLVDRRLRLDLELFTKGGEAILENIKANSYDVLARRPTLSLFTKGRLTMSGLISLATQNALRR